MGIKKIIRAWLFADELEQSRGIVEQMEQYRLQIAELHAHYKVGMADDAWLLRQFALEAKQSIKARAPKPLWRRYTADHVGKNYGRLASAASLSTYPEKATVVGVSAGIYLALPGPVVAEHDAGGFVALQHLPIDPHRRLPVIDFGTTAEEALFNLNQQLMQVALHEGWTIKEPTQ